MLRSPCRNLTNTPKLYSILFIVLVPSVSVNLKGAIFMADLSPTDLFTTKQAAEILGVTPRTLRYWNEKKIFMPFIIDHKGEFRYTREQISQLKSVYHKGWENIYKNSAPLSDFPTISSGQNVKLDDSPGGQSLDDFFRNPENKIIQKINFQIFPSKLRIVTNDRLSKKIFELTQDDLHDWIENHKTMNFIEMFNHKKFGEITSPIKLSVDGENFSISEPLDQFDGAVLSVCNSEWIAKNPITTPSIIYRGLTGKVGKNDAEPSKDQLTAIFNSINKLMRLQLDYDLSDLCEKLKYNGGKPERLISTLLPCHYLKSSTINGKDTTVIYFDREPVLLTVAKIKNYQLLTYDATLLDVPKQNNTPMNISVKNYVMQRVQEIKLHKLTPVITFDDIFQKCRLENASRDKKLDARVC